MQGSAIFRYRLIKRSSDIFGALAIGACVGEPNGSKELKLLFYGNNGGGRLRYYHIATELDIVSFAHRLNR